MFEQEKNVANFVPFAQRHELLLQTKAGGIVDDAELENGDHFFFKDLRRLDFFATEDTERHRENQIVSDVE